MKRLFLVLLISVSSLSFAMEKGIYGKDDRKEIFEIENAQIRNIARSVATQVSRRNIEYSGDGGRITYQRTMGEEYSMCSDQLFQWQINPGECSGVLVGPDLLLTAGHCVRDKSECRTFKWLFDFAYKESFDEELSQFSHSNIYSCKEIVDSEYGEWTRKDYALIRLNRVVEGRTPVRYRAAGKIDKKDSVFAIGYPMGIPAKYAGNGSIGNNGRRYSFFTNLDTFVVNSGSPIFNAETLELEGILIKGGRDIKFNHDEQCNRYFYEEVDSHKEEVFRVT